MTVEELIEQLEMLDGSFQVFAGKPNANAFSIDQVIVEKDDVHLIEWD